MSPGLRLVALASTAAVDFGPHAAARLASPLHHLTETLLEVVAR